MKKLVVLTALGALLMVPALGCGADPGDAPRQATYDPNLPPSSPPLVTPREPQPSPPPHVP